MYKYQIEMELYDAIKINKFKFIYLYHYIRTGEVIPFPLPFTSSSWSKKNKYKTLESAQQALRDIRKNNKREEFEFQGITLGRVKRYRINNYKK